MVTILEFIAFNRVILWRFVPYLPRKTAAQVDAIVLGLFEKARIGKIAASRHVLQAFGLSAKATFLEAPTISAAVTSKLEMFRAGEKWCRNFVQRQNLKIKVLHGEAGSVNAQLVKEGMEKIREACKNYPPCWIFNVDETGIMWKLMPRRTYLSTKQGGSEDRKGYERHEVQGSHLRLHVRQRGRYR